VKLRDILPLICFLSAVFSATLFAQYDETPSLGIFDTLTVKNFNPQSRLEVPAHTVLRSRFPSIDSHSHPYLKGEDIHRWVQMMRACNVRKVVVLSGCQPDSSLEAVIKDYLGKYPQHFQIWAHIDAHEIDAPDYAKRAARSVEKAYEMGARGIGEYKDMGWGFGGDRRNGKKGVHLDDPRWDLALETAGRLGMPISIHVGDMEDCYYPLTAESELGTSGAPWNVYGKPGILPRAEIQATRNRAIAKHPNTIFIGCHVGNLSHDLNEVGRLLDLYPNFYIDLSARAWDLGRQPFTARKFIIRYQDRILWGTDLNPDEDMYRGWFRLFETEDEFFRVPDAAWWMNYGLNLPDEVLQKIYYLNATRLFKDMDGGAW